MRVIMDHFPDDPPEHELHSNGRLISFEWKGLLLRDACLPTMSGLKDAAASCGAPVAKGSLPHAFKKEELQNRVAGRTYEEWKRQQPAWKEFQAKRDDICDFRQLSQDYLEGDVRCLWWVVRRNGDKLSEAQRALWQVPNRGGWVSVLAELDVTAAEGKRIYGKDVTSLYPASASRIVFPSRAGLQEPLKKWYHGFPDASGGWEKKDFAGEVLTD